LAPRLLRHGRKREDADDHHSNACIHFVRYNKKSEPNKKKLA
jgi:hypothetical protein